MLRSLKDLEQYTVKATDGDIGRVVDFLLDDEGWVVRYLVVQTGGAMFLNGRRVLISPISFKSAEWSTGSFNLTLTKDKVKNSPDVDVDKPVSRQHERAYSRYFGYPYYWRYSGAWAMEPYPAQLAAANLFDEAPGDGAPEDAGDVHLRSAKELRRYHIQGSDDAIGHVDDFIVDDESWHIRYLVVDTRNWWFGKRVLVSPHWATKVSWAEDKVHVDLTREAIKNSPEWNPTEGINREYETRLYDYHGRPTYWTHQEAPAATPPRARAGH